MKKIITFFTLFFLSNITLMSDAMDRGGSDGHVTVVRNPEGIASVHPDGRSRLILRGPVDNNMVMELNVRHGAQVERQGMLWNSPYMIISIEGIPSDATLEEYRQIRDLTLRYSVYHPAYLDQT